MSAPRVEVHEDAAALATVGGRGAARPAGRRAGGRPRTRRSRSPAARSPTRSTASSPSSPPSSEVDWTRVVVWWGDERFVAPGSPDRNAGQARAAFLDAVGADPAVHAMPSTERRRDRRRGRRGVRRRAARARRRGVRGGDARHRPGRPRRLAVPGPAGARRRRRDRGRRHRLPQAAAGADQPDLPRAQPGPAVWFLVSGEDKADAVARALGGADLHDIPAAGVAGREETIWFLDRASASAL